MWDVSQKVKFLGKWRQIFRGILGKLSFPCQAREHFLMLWRWLQLCMFLGRMTESWIFSLMTQERGGGSSTRKTCHFHPLAALSNNTKFSSKILCVRISYMSETLFLIKDDAETCKSMCKVSPNSKAAQRSRRHLWDRRVQVFQAEPAVV